MSKNKIQTYKNNQPLVLLITLFSFLFFTPLIQNTVFNELFNSISLLVIAGSGFYIVPKSERKRFYKFLYYLVITLTTAATLLLVFHLANEIMISIVRIVWSVFLIVVFFQIFKLSLKSTYQAIDSLLISVSGYIVLGFIGAIIFSLVDEMNPESFVGHFSFHDFIYFSFVTMTTLGYGDVVPDSVSSKTFAIVLTLLGQMYVAIVIALNLAKYMSLMKENKNQENTKETEKLIQLEKKIDALMDEVRESKKTT